MAINLRSVSKELHALLKVRAAKEKVSIESLCVRFLWWGLDVKPSSVAGGNSKRVGLGSQPKPAPKPKGKSGDVLTPMPSIEEMSRRNSELTVATVRRLREEESLHKGHTPKAVDTVFSPNARPAHDPTCPCMMCNMARAAKKKP